MPKTIFGTTEKSNFILNMDLDWYREKCVKLLLIILWATAASMCINQLTFSVNGKLAELNDGGGFGQILALCAIGLRSVATIFSVGGVFALIWTNVGLMRKQWTKATAVPYLLLAGSLAWGIVSICHSYSYKISIFGQDGRDEGWIALLMYGAMFYLGTMLRKKQNLERFAAGLTVFGIVQGIWALLQSQPFFDFPNSYSFIEPLLYKNVKLPSGLTDSPVTFAMLLAILTAVSIPAALLAEEKKHRITATVCAGLSMLLTFKTQTIAGLIAGFGGLLLTGLVLCLKGKDAKGKKWVLPVVVAAAACCSALWTYFTPSINGIVHAETQIENGFALYDGGILWDDGNYRLSTCGTYSIHTEHDFDIYDSVSVLRYSWGEAAKVIKKYPLLGTGPDNFYFTQLHKDYEILNNPNSIDRPYNDYLFIAATRGILSLLIHLALLGIALILAWKNRKKLQSWALLSAGAAVVLYALTAIVGISVLSVAPLFWILLGMLTGEPIADTLAKPAEKTNETKPAKAKSEKQKQPASAVSSADTKSKASARSSKSGKKKK